MSNKITYAYTVGELRNIIISSTAVSHYGTKWVARKKVEKIEESLRKSKNDTIPRFHKQKIKSDNLIECVRLIFKHQELANDNTKINLDKSYGELTMDLSLSVMSKSLEKSLAILENKKPNTERYKEERIKIRRILRRSRKFGPK